MTTYTYERLRRGGEALVKEDPHGTGDMLITYSEARGDEVNANQHNMAEHLGIETEKRNELYYIKIWNLFCIFTAGWAAGMVTAGMMIWMRMPQ